MSSDYKEGHYPRSRRTSSIDNSSESESESERDGVILQYQQQTKKKFTKEEMERIQEQWESSEHQTMRESEPVELYDFGSAVSVGDTLGRWWSRLKQKVHLEQLKQQVEEQRRILRIEADRIRKRRRKQTSSSTLSSHRATATAGAAAAEMREGGRTIDVSDPALTKTGIGMSVQFEVNDDDDDDNDHNDEHDDDENGLLLHIMEEEDSEENYAPLVLEASTLHKIASTALPSSLTFCRWKRLYSLARDGDSFHTMLRHVEGHSKSLLVVRTTDFQVFGGYADSTWQSRPGYFGGGQAVLFKVLSSSSPLEEDSSNNSTSKNHSSDEELPSVECYRWTGANRYVQICNSEKKMIAMGGGGRDGAFGLCLVDDFSRGSTGHCDTFANDPLVGGSVGSRRTRTPTSNSSESQAHAHAQFDILDVEVWGFLPGLF